MWCGSNLAITNHQRTEERMNLQFSAKRSHCSSVLCLSHTLTHTHRKTKKLLLGNMAGEDAVDESQLTLCCALCCTNCATLPITECTGCSESSGSAALTWKFAANPVLPVFPASAVDLRAMAARD
jgi:hypothetical protein